MVPAVEKDLDGVKKDIRRLGMQARMTREPMDQHRLQVEIQKLEREKMRLRQKLFSVEDDISAKRDQLIDRLAVRMKNERRVDDLFILHWTLI